MKKNSIKNTIVACTIAGMITLGGTGSEAALGSKALYKGVNHRDVKELQQGLKKLNFFTYGKYTTYFGNITKQAVMKFQKANGLAVDGSFGPASAVVLKNNLNADKKEEVKPQEPAKAVEKTEADAVATVPTSLTYTKALKFGSKGNEVKALQEVLTKYGHYKGKIDSVFANTTKEAVMSFQRAQKLAVDGSVGPATNKVLNDVLSGKVAAGKPTAAPSRSDASKSKSVNIINTAKKYLGARYAFGGSSPSGFDCSGFTQFVYKQNGINIPRATTGQANAGTKLSKSQLQPGDLLIFSNTYKAGVSHAGIYIGNGQFIHAGNSKTGVLTSTINSGHYSKKFSYGRRVY